MFKIEFEGTDGAGKTTGMTYFIEKAREKGLSVIETREVGNPNIQICAEMRKAVLDPNSGLNGEGMEIVFSAMRMFNDVWYRKLQKSDNPPDLVVSDRGYLSHLAYTDHNVSEEFTNQLYINLVGMKTLLPDFVIYFKVNTDTALKRRIKRGESIDAIEMKGVEFQEKVRESFEKYIEANRFKIMTYEVDANQDLDSVKIQLDTIFNNICGWEKLKTKNPAI